MESMYYACVTSAYQVLRLLVHHWTEYWFPALVQVQSNIVQDAYMKFAYIILKKKGMNEFKDQVDNIKKNNNSHNNKQVSSLIYPV